MDTVPPATAVTRPRFETVAIAEFDVLHATDRPVMALPSASLATAVACVVLPATRLELPRVTPTDDTTAVETVRFALPLTPSTVALIEVEPLATAVTTPWLDTVATLGFELAHVTARPEMPLPAESRAVATACVV